MAFELMNFSTPLALQQAAEELVKCNEFTAQYGLALTLKQATALVESRTQALNTSGRVEFGAGVIDRLIRAFCDSPYLSQGTYAETMQSLIELFYEYKNESLDRLTDDALINYMQQAFDGSCQGSLELLEERELEKLARNLRCGRPANYEEPDLDVEDTYGAS